MDYPKLSDNKQFIEYYYNIQANLEKVTENRYITNVCVLEASINLSNLFELVLKLSDSGDIDANNFIRWNYCSNLVGLNIKASTSDIVASNRQRLFYKKLEKKYDQLVNKASFTTNINNINSAVSFIQTKIKENKIDTRPTKKSIAHLVKLYQDIVEIWPYYNEGKDNKIRDNVDKLNESIQSILNSAELHNEKKELSRSFSLSVELLENELGLCESQTNQISISIQKHNEYLKQSSLAQFAEKCGEQYDLLKKNMDTLIKNSKSLQNIKLLEVLRPSQFFTNCSLIVSHSKMVGKSFLELIKKNPIKTIAITAGAIIIGLTLSFVSVGVASPILAFAATDAALFLGGVGAVGATTAISVSGSVVKSVLSEENQKLEGHFSNVQERFDQHNKDVMESTKKRIEDCWLIKVDETLKDTQHHTQALEVEQYSNLYVRSRNESLESIHISRDIVDHLDDQQISIENTTKQLFQKLELLKKRLKESKQVINDLNSFNIGDDDVDGDDDDVNIWSPDQCQKDNNNKNESSNNLSLSDVMPLFNKWYTISANEGSIENISLILKLMKNEQYQKLIDWCDHQEAMNKFFDFSKT